MSDFGEWLRELTEPWDDPGKGNWDNAFVFGLADLAAQQHEALRLLAPKGPEGMKLQADVLKAAEAFQDKYE